MRSVRSQNPSGFGGCIFSGDELDPEGRVADAREYVVVKAPASLLAGVTVERGQWWRVEGARERFERHANGVVLSETQIIPSSLALTRPSGEHIVRYLADHSGFAGIGEVKARRLWEAFVEELYELLDAGDRPRLEQAVSGEVADTLVRAWREFGRADALRWLQSRGFGLRVGAQLLKAYGDLAPALIEEDPYRLLSFGGGWARVDDLARSEFGIKADDLRRLLAGVEEALYGLYDHGSTRVPIESVTSRLAAILGGAGAASELAREALEAGRSNGAYLLHDDRSVSLVGPYVMEREIAQRIAALLQRDEPLMSESEVDTHLRAFEQSAGLTLNERQRQAVRAAARHAFVIITGGAGVGKTTTLQGVAAIAERARLPVRWVALSGRAAKRIREATGEPSSTIAGLVHGAHGSDLPEPCLLVIDEASMVDLHSLYRLIRALPERVRVVMVGDPYQLPPVAPGLTLHELIRIPEVPVVELTEVRRYGSEIAAFAASVRAGALPNDPPRDTSGAVAFVPCRREALNDTVLALYRQDRTRTQVLTATRTAGHGGGNAINGLCQRAMTRERDALMVWSDELSRPVSAGLHVGDPILCTRNLWDVDLQNGSLGTLASVTRHDNDAGGELGSIEWDDGQARPVTLAMLADLELAYAITVHKAQGSQFPRVIIPITPSRNLDRTLLYTAVTRAQGQVILVGDERVAERFLAAAPQVQRRSVSLGALVRACLGGTS